jgi:PAS domain S-box-containing protein
MLNLKNSLILRIALPIIILVLALGALLYFYVLTPVSKFTKESIEHDLTTFSRRLDNICNINFDRLLLSGNADNEEALIIERALTLGQIEDFFDQENLKGLIYDSLENQVLFQSDLPTTAEYLTNYGYGQEKLISLKVREDHFYIYYSNFEPWDWHIIIVKDAEDYSNLFNKIRKLYTYSLGSLVLIAFLLIFFIFQSINRPVKAIIKTIHEQKKPAYKGIDVFEFLSETIADMMESIHQNSEKYRILVENSNHLVWEVDQYSRFTYVSPTVTAILGYIPDEVIGSTPFDFMPTDEGKRLRLLYKQKAEKKLSLEGIIDSYIHKDGNLVILETNGVPIFDNDGDYAGYRGINRDITERVQAEKEKINAQATAADHAKHALLGRVAGKMAHDFNNILGIIMGNTELALLDCKDEEILRTLELTLDQTLRGKNLTKNLVVFAKDQELKQEFFNLNEKINLVINLLKKDLEGIDVINQEDINLPDLLADPGMIEHAIVNLIQNSIHAISKTENPKIIVKTYYHKNNIYFEISDNGCGIPKKHLKKIYEPSFTLKGLKDVTDSYEAGIKGTGYGMINVKKCVEQHKGNISVKSKINYGTKFIIALPVIKKGLTNKEKKEISKSNIQSNKRILLVEDETSISDVLFRILTQKPCNHIVDIADSGQLAMDLVNKNKYDLISLDYILIGRDSGLDIYMQTRQINKDLPILFVSGNMEFIESIKKLKQKDDHIDYLSKPFQNIDYVKSINELLGKSVKG